MIRARSRFFASADDLVNWSTMIVGKAWDRGVVCYQAALRPTRPRCQALTGHVTEEMQRKYSTVGLDEKRAADLRLFPPDRSTPLASAGGSGIQAPETSRPVERQLNRPCSFAKLRAGYGIRTHDVQLGKLTLYH